MARQRYRTGYHWAHLLNPSWQRLPSVQHAVVKPYAYRKVHRGRNVGRLHDEVRWHGFTVLLSVPSARQGMVVASVEDEVEAEAIAAAVAGALQVPWRRA